MLVERARGSTVGAAGAHAAPPAPPPLLPAAPARSGARPATAAALLAALTGAVPIETHISAVFIGPDAAFKLKKAVNLGFLDFSTIDDRERFLRRELALNAPHAPGLYRAVRPIGRLGLDALPAEDWVLEMAPVPPGDFLDRHPLNDTLLDALGDAVAAMHASLPPLLHVDQRAALHRALAGNTRAALAAGRAGDERDFAGQAAFGC
jgi:aminoglycoside phosphotransferase family enzyme